MHATHPTQELGTIVSIWAHPDDETFLAGAVMADAAAHGHRVVCVTATAGERGTDHPDAWPPERLGQVRRWEAEAAMAILGVGEHVVLGLPDGDLVSHEAEGIWRIGELLDQVEPDTILTFGPDGYTFHPDHVAVHRWVTAAWQQRGCVGRLLYAAATADHLDRHGDEYERRGVYMTEDRPVGADPSALALYVAPIGRLLDQKLTALRAMATQTHDSIAGSDPAHYARLVAEEAFVEASPSRLGPPATGGTRLEGAAAS
jgi:LmbE family N-acetylglucosaminyl deacetylase